MVLKKENDRRSFLKKLSLASATALAGTLPIRVKAAAPEEPAGPNGLLVQPYLQAMTPDGVTVSFVTLMNAYSWIEYGIDALDHKAHTVDQGLINANVRVNSIRLENLKPGTTYQYRVVSKGMADFQPYKVTFEEPVFSETYSFTTPALQAESVSCIIFNDIHNRKETYQTLMQLGKHQPFDFALLNGDLVDWLTNEKQLAEQVLQPCASLFASRHPLVIVRGNHDVRGKFARELKHYFASKNGRYYQNFTQGPVHFVMLDSGEDNPDKNGSYSGIVDFDSYREEQGRWFSQIAETKEFRKAKYRVVFIHIPLFHTKKDKRGNLHCREIFHPLFEKHRVDLVISGHTHTFGVHPPSSLHRYPIVIGGGPKDGFRTMMQLKADRSALTLDMWLDDGRKVGEYRI